MGLVPHPIKYFIEIGDYRAITPPPITGTILSMAHASGNKWVDEINGVKWDCSRIVSPYTKIKRFPIKMDSGSRIDNKPYILTQNSRIYSKLLHDNITGNEDYTLCLWFNCHNSNNFTLICSNIYYPFNESNIIIYNQGSSNLVVNTTGTSDLWFDIPTTNINEWHHCALTRKSGVTRLFVDGKIKGTRSDMFFPIVLNNTIGTGIHVESTGNGGAVCNRSYDEIVVIKGQALWTEEFDPDIDWGYTWKPYVKDIEDEIKLY